MDNHVSLHWAYNELRTTGRVRLTGAPALWSNTIQILLTVLIVLVGLLGVGGIVGGIAVIASGAVRVTPATIVGGVGVFAMITVGLVLLLALRRKRETYRGLERTDVVVEPRGLTLRGVGPIPWHDFGPAEHRMVRAEHDSGYTRRAVMALSQSGYVNVNRRLPLHLRSRVCPATGPMWKRDHRWIYVPGVDGLGQNEVMQLINTAHSMFTGYRPGR
ncbi:MAG TPA: hypothetical protein H9902_01945 [Candidatus Stackebrandtia faecavium]|nr:hypothetical protein [Candidatus Stackebrandtia faecavium]